VQLKLFHAVNKSERCVFLDSLVSVPNRLQCRLGENSGVDTKLLTFECDDHFTSPKINQISTALSAKTLSLNNRKNIVENGSLFPEIDNFVRDLISSDNGYIRKCSTPTHSDLFIYDIAGNYKFCENIGRHHKSNNVRIVVDLKLGQYYQTCHDPECENFKSRNYQLPGCATPWQSFNETIDLKENKPNPQLSASSIRYVGCEFTNLSNNTEKQVLKYSSENKNNSSSYETWGFDDEEFDEIVRKKFCNV